MNAEAVLAELVRVNLVASAAILLVLWIVGMVSANTFGGLLHVILILIVAAVVIAILRSRRI